jgi:hypothetical protein
MEPEGIVVSSSPRRIIVLCTLLIALLLPFLNCKKQDQGVEGTVLFWEGNFMCCPIRGTQTPVQREVYVYELTNSRQATEIQHKSCFYSSVQTKFVAKTTSDSFGFYHLRLNPGKYSLFIMEGSLFYANAYDGYGNIQSIEVVAGLISRLDIDITYKAVL